MAHRFVNINFLLGCMLVAGACSRNSDQITGPDPSLQSMDPALVCVGQGARQVAILGDGLAPLMRDAATDDPFLELPSLFLQRTADLFGEADAGEEIQVPLEDLQWTDQQNMAIMVAADLPDGIYGLRVKNGSGREALLASALAIVPPPTVESVDPDLTCVAQTAQQVIVSGQAFLEVDGVLPIVTIGGTDFSPLSADNCTALAAPAEHVRLCTSLTVEIPAGGLPVGSHALVVSNPDPAACSSEQAISLAVVPAPTLDAIEPEFFCGAQQDASLTLFGSGFLKVGAALPQVTIGAEVLQADGVDDCQPVAGTSLTASVCNQLFVTLPAGDRPAGWQAVSVQNPQPAGCSVDATEGFYLVGPPRMDDLGPSTPCDPQPTELIVTGDGFLDRAGVLPQAFVAGVEATVAVTDCTPLPDYVAVSVCTGLILTVPAGTLDLGDHLVRVVNPGEPVCEVEATLHLGLPPVVSSISPLELCQSGGTLTVNGSGFFDGAVVQISTADDTLMLDTTYVDDNTLQATVPDPTPTGLYDVTAINPDGCQATLQTILDITPLPVVFFVDPSVMYNGVNLQATIYTSGILGTVSEVLIFPTGDPGQAQALVFSVDPQDRVQAIVPAGLSAGLYDVSVTDDLACTGSLIEAVEVVSELTVAIDRVELPFGWTDARTGVNIYSPEVPDPLVNFQATPRFYINPQNAAVDTVASELKSTAFVSPTRASSAVPAQMPVGMYDLIAINPDGGVGFLPNAFEVTALPPPTISDLAPASVINQDQQVTTLSGENFRNPIVDTTCLQPDSSTVDLTGTVQTFDANSIVVEYDFITQTVQDGSICLLQVTNDDGTYALYSALGVTNPSMNLEHFSATSDLNVARRAPCVAAGEASPGARFVYTIGGDDGVDGTTTAGTYYDSVEVAAIDPYGDLGGWTILPYTLPVGRSFHACQSIGRYIFVAGGTEGGAALNTVWRAKILDPLESPQIVDVDLYVDAESYEALPEGRYSYRVSAQRAADDTDNPDGETLPSDPFQIQTPNIEAGITLTISWTAVPGAIGYRVYRTPTPDLPSGNEVLIAEVDGATLTFGDDGSAVPGVEQPLPICALGQFAAQPSMGTAREGAAIALAADPTDQSQLYMYMLGGRDDAAAALDSLEWLPVQVAGPGSQVVGNAWVPGNATIDNARWQLAAFVADGTSAPDLMPADESWIYVGGGNNANLTAMIPNVTGMKVAAGGALGEGVDEWFALDTMQPFRAGYTPAIFNNQLFAFGGMVGSAASLESSSIEMCGLGAGACSNASVPEPPELSNWNSLGIDLTVARYLAGGTTVSAFIFLVGGIDDSFPAVPLAATEKTLW